MSACVRGTCQNAAEWGEAFCSDHSPWLRKILDKHEIDPEVMRDKGDPLSQKCKACRKPTGGPFFCPDHDPKNRGRAEPPPVTERDLKPDNVLMGECVGCHETKEIRSRGRCGACLWSGVNTKKAAEAHRALAESKPAKKAAKKPKRRRRVAQKTYEWRHVKSFEELDAWRVAHGLSQRSVPKAAGVSLGAYTAWKKGRVPNYETQRKLAELIAGDPLTEKPTKKAKALAARPKKAAKKPKKKTTKKTEADQDVKPDNPPAKPASRPVLGLLARFARRASDVLDAVGRELERHAG